MLDGNSAAELANDMAQIRDERRLLPYQSSARENVRAKWLEHLNMDQLMDSIAGLTASETKDLLHWVVADFESAGSLLSDAVERTADEYLKTEAGQQAIADEAENLSWGSYT